MKKLLSLCLVFLCLFSMSACGNVYTDAEANEILDTLLTREADLNGYIYFDSFKTKDDPGDDIYSDYQHYYLVHPDSKYVTLASLMGEVDAIFTKEGREPIYDYAFLGFNDGAVDDGIAEDGESVSRPSRFHEDKEGLKINVSDEGFSGRTQYLLGSAKVKRSNETHIRAEITTYRFDKNGNPILHKKEIEVLFEDGAWKLMGQTLIAGVIAERLIEE